MHFPFKGCLNGGEGHVNTRGEETCVCSPDFKGDHCEISKLSPSSHINELSSDVNVRVLANRTWLKFVPISICLSSLAVEFVLCVCERLRPFQLVGVILSMLKKLCRMKVSSIIRTHSFQCANQSLKLYYTHIWY